jgi:predicted HTH transcriptional regulator
VPPFDPFGKPPSALSADDLVALKDVAEGWYVEYKREVPPVSSVAKSISAFANHYGGWVFYGIVEKNRLPDSFPGIPSQAVSGLTDRIRDAARTFIQPVPEFELQVVKGSIRALPGSEGAPEDQVGART